MSAVPQQYGAQAEDEAIVILRRLEPVLARLEDRTREHGAMLASLDGRTREHGAMLASLDERTREHGVLLARLGEIVRDHGVLLAKLNDRLSEHGEAIARLDGRVSGIEIRLAQVPTTWNIAATMLGINAGIVALAFGLVNVLRP
jgi:hypothetical protein